ncbi:hypothetical protein GCM10007147_41680 [Nocardiopsis kunsanensis]|uniref:Bacteriocin biosynthesis cyclodehydratase domain-containing protein n=2 Tax=Nocardiopsis kunsanensis TaxID=141693 RepID=A0A919CL79_9ACTN|nr:hypothetical protein GCM10007147_41680 [Nocardiopsis kunsanensis]
MTTDTERAVSAQRMADAAVRDPQLRPPDRPRLVRGLVTRTVPGALLVHGGPERVVLRGRSATRLVPAALDLLDGTRDTGALADELGVSEQSAAAVVALLRSKGIIEDRYTGPAPKAGDDVVEALSRRVDRTRVRSSGEEAALALELTPVRITAGEDSLVGGDLAAALRRAGARDVAVSGPSDTRARAADTLVVTLGSGSEVDRALAEASREGRLALPLRCDGISLTVGPLVRADLPCGRCATEAVGEALEAAGPEAGAGAGPRAEGPLLRAAEALAVAQVVGVLTRSSPLRTVRRLLRVRLEGWSESEVVAPARPGCRQCLPDPSGSDPRPLLLEEQLAFPPSDLVDPREHQGHYAPANVALQGSQRSLPVGERLRVDPGPLVPGRPLGEALAEIALRTVGVRSSGEGGVRRWSPTGGNIGSPQLDLVVPPGTGGLQEGVWAVDPFGGELVRRSARAPNLPGVSEDEAALVFTGGMRRMGEKYGANAYRLVHLDSGVARAQAMLVAHSLGLGVRPLLGWDDTATGAAVGARVDQEPVTGVLAVSERPGTGGGGDPLPAPPRPGPEEHGSPGLMLGSVLETVREAGAGRVRLGARGAGTGALDGATVPAPGGLEPLLRVRRSVREWSDRPVSASDAGSVLRAARAGSRSLAGPGEERVSSVLLAMRAEGTEPGAYTLGEGGLEQIKPLAPDALTGAVLQPEYAGAPLLLLALLPLSSESGDDAVHTYRHLLGEAGASLYTGWLHGCALGLAGGIFAGVLPTFSAALCDAHPGRARPVLGLALGHTQDR